MNSALVRLLKTYEKQIYPKISHLRGATRLRSMLRRLPAKRLERVEPSMEEDIFEKDWENLIIIDGCRSDTYEEVTGEKGSIVSKACNSRDFIRKYFSEGEKFSEIVCITANPHLYPPIFSDITGREPNEVFGQVYHTYDTDWDDEHGTVLPESVVRDAKTAEKLFPDKKKIIWFMQPHAPSVPADLGSGFDPKLEFENVEGTGMWGLAERGEISRDEAYEAYKQNLEYVMDYVDDLVNYLSGKTVVTSDHGNVIGEKGLYGHGELFRSSNVRVLKEVPWDVRQ